MIFFCLRLSCRYIFVIKDFSKDFYDNSKDHMYCTLYQCTVYTCKRFNLQFMICITSC